MSCGSCPKVEEHNPLKSGLQYSLAQDAAIVEGKTGKTFPIKSCLIPRPYAPRGGWSVVLWIYGQRTVVNGNSANEIFYLVKSLLELNEFKYNDLDIWFNLNIQWLENAIPKYQQVTLESLMQLAQSNY